MKETFTMTSGYEEQAENNQAGIHVEVPAGDTQPTSELEGDEFAAVTEGNQTTETGTTKKRSFSGMRLLQGVTAAAVLLGASAETAEAAPGGLKSGAPAPIAETAPKLTYEQKHEQSIVLLNGWITEFHNSDLKIGKTQTKDRTMNARYGVYHKGVHIGEIEGAAALPGFVNKGHFLQKIEGVLKANNISFDEQAIEKEIVVPPPELKVSAYAKTEMAKRGIEIKTVQKEGRLTIALVLSPQSVIQLYDSADKNFDESNTQVEFSLDASDNLVVRNILKKGVVERVTIKGNTFNPEDVVTEGR